MPSFGYSLMCELYGPSELLAQAARAEEAGFDFVTISDHFHPWLHSQRHAFVALGDTDRFFELWEQELHRRLESIAV